MRRAAGSAASSASGKQKKRQTSSLSGAPNASATCPVPDSGRKFVNAPSPSSAASASILPRSAATTIGTGYGGGVSSLNPPGPRSPASTGRSPSIAARMRESGFSNGTPFQRSTITFDDEPSPRTKRPREASASAVRRGAEPDHEAPGGGVRERRAVLRESRRPGRVRVGGAGREPEPL